MAIHASNLLETPGNSNPCLGYLTVTSVGPFTSTYTWSTFRYLLTISATCQQLSGSLLPPWLSGLTKNHLVLWNEFWLKNVFPPKQEEKLGITVVNDVEYCDLKLIVFDGKVHLYRCRDMLITLHTKVGPCISHTINIVDKSAIREVVKSFSQFYHHLRLTEDVKLTKVRMELRLLEEIGDDFASVLTPTGENLIADEPATIVVNEHACLGMTMIHVLIPDLCAEH